MGHYFINDPNLKSNKKIIKYTFLGKEVSFFTDNGIFSKDRVDFGTNVLLNSLEDLSRYKKVLDVGCGVGSASILAAYGVDSVHVTAIDIDEAATKLAAENYQANGINAKVICNDVSDFPLTGERFDAVITNPPFFKPGTGRKSPLKSIARHENVELSTWISFCIKRLKPNGRFYIIHTSDRIQDILVALHAYHSYVGGITIEPISFKQNADPKRVIITAQHSSKTPPIINSQKIVGA